MAFKTIFYERPYGRTYVNICMTNMEMAAQNSNLFKNQNINLSTNTTIQSTSNRNKTINEEIGNINGKNTQTAKISNVVTTNNNSPAIVLINGKDDLNAIWVWNEDQEKMVTSFGTGFVVTNVPKCLRHEEKKNLQLEDCPACYIFAIHELAEGKFPVGIYCRLFIGNVNINLYRHLLKVDRTLLYGRPGLNGSPKCRLENSLYVLGLVLAAPLSLREEIFNYLPRSVTVLYCYYPGNENLELCGNCFVKQFPNLSLVETGKNQVQQMSFEKYLNLFCNCFYWCNTCEREPLFTVIS